MKIMVMGTGGVGGYFGGKLANAGYDVSFIARRKHMQAIVNNGLKIISPSGNMLIKPANVSENPKDFDKPDIILLCVKAFDTEFSCNLIKSSLKIFLRHFLFEV